ncbi:EamA family transporter [Actinoalloteichus caeruleus]|uniref:EamA family transporter n=1 Tax=Actinoalloteichus cyanogriseus TaxID=2893586 RepID=UPI00068DA249|nr:EamA family transporter [Actinoalloteichus caeruleus]
MPLRHCLLALSVAVVWGLNFVAISASLEHFPPMFLVALRFAVVAIPTVLFVPAPGVPLRWLLGYGCGFGIVQFLFLFWGMAVGMPTGLASLVLQSSAPFTVLLGATVLRERISARQLAGILVGVGGLAVVGWYRAETASVVPFLLTVAGAFGWAVGNICGRLAKPSSPVRLMLWMCVVPPLPMFALAFVVEGPTRIGVSLSTLGAPGAWAALLGLAYTVLIAGVLGSGAWTWLLARHPAGVVAPFSMLAPVVGMTAAWLVLRETVAAWELLGGLLIVGGVLLGCVGRQGTGTRLPRVAPPGAPEPSEARVAGNGRLVNPRPPG